MNKYEEELVDLIPEDDDCYPIAWDETTLREKTALLNYLFQKLLYPFLAPTGEDFLRFYELPSAYEVQHEVAEYVSYIQEKAWRRDRNTHPRLVVPAGYRWMFYDNITRPDSPVRPPGSPICGFNGIVYWDPLAMKNWIAVEEAIPGEWVVCREV